jgi:predicted transcriptional regulator YheO
MTAEVDDQEPSFTTSERAHAALVVSLVGPIVPALAQALAPRTEVVLHNLTTMPNTITAIAGTVTGREVGGPPTDLGLRSFRDGQTEHWLRYRTELDGLQMRSSSIYFHAPSGKPVVCLCLNADITGLLKAQEVLAGLTAIDLTGLAPQPVAEPTETFADSIESLSDGVLNQAIAAVGVPVGLMKKAQKFAVTQDLERRGFFALRGAVDHAAQRLNVSRHTIYNYLNELQGESNVDKK